MTATMTSYHRTSVSINYNDADQRKFSTAPGHGRQATRHPCLGLRGEGASFLMAHRNPLDLASFERASDQIESVTHDTVTMPDTCALQGLNDDIRNLLAHGMRPCCDHLCHSIRRDSEGGL